MEKPNPDIYYYLNPKHCQHCGLVIPYEKRDNTFCGRSCSASFHGKGKCKNKPKPGVTPGRKCLNCGEYLKLRTSKYCNQTCQHQHKYKQNMVAILATGTFDKIAVHSSVMKKYLYEIQGYKCAICGMVEHMGLPVPLILDHINGDGHDHRLCNLRLVCGICDMRLPTYKSKNRGNGREERRLHQRLVAKTVKERNSTVA